jgi:putative membrane protein
MFLWVVHVAAMIGITAGYESWFVNKTALSLLLSLFLLVVIYPITTRPMIAVFGLCYLLGFAVEYLGVNYGLFFGTYAYGESLGPKLLGVPLLIGANWAILTLISGTLVSRWINSKLLRVVAGSVLMLILDFLLEGIAPQFDYWEFQGGHAPPSNYIAWFCIALVMHIIFQIFRASGHYIFSMNLYLVQLLFFGYFYGYYNV